MKWTSAFLCLVGLFCSLASSVRVVKLGGKDCEFEGGRICNGAVTKEIGKKLLKVCSDGKIKTKTRKSVGEGYPLVGRDTGEGKGIKSTQMKQTTMQSFGSSELISCNCSQMYCVFM